MGCNEKKKEMGGMGAGWGIGRSADAILSECIAVAGEGGCVVGEWGGLDSQYNRGDAS